MSNTYTQIHIQAVFAVKNRAALIDRLWQDELYRYITGIIQSYDHKLLAIGGMPDHIHIFFGLRPAQSLSDLIQEVKGCSSAWINRQGLARGHFAWQQGFGGFSYSRSHIPAVIRYIQNQEQHHKRKTFLDEYRQLLDAFGITYDEQYIFKPPS